MPIACLLVALVSGVVCAMLWLLSGGPMMSALVVYLLAGKLAATLVIGHAALRFAQVHRSH